MITVGAGGGGALPPAAGHRAMQKLGWTRSDVPTSTCPLAVLVPVCIHREKSHVFKDEIVCIRLDGGVPPRTDCLHGRKQLTDIMIGDRGFW